MNVPKPPDREITRRDSRLSWVEPEGQLQARADSPDANPELALSGSHPESPKSLLLLRCLKRLFPVESATRSRPSHQPLQYAPAPHQPFSEMRHLTCPGFPQRDASDAAAAGEFASGQGARCDGSRAGTPFGPLAPPLPPPALTVYASGALCNQHDSRHVCVRCSSRRAAQGRHHAPSHRSDKPSSRRRPAPGTSHERRIDTVTDSAHTRAAASRQHPYIVATA